MSGSELDVDIPFYRGSYADLQNLSDEAIRVHYNRDGEREGRQASPLALKDGIIGSIERSEAVLEIGPGRRPLVRGEKVRYFDVVSREVLMERCRRGGVSPDTVPNIDFVSDSGDLSIVPDGGFDVVVSSHSIEHHPDLVHHLNNVARICRPNGRYILIIPDKRYCFDHFLPESTIADVVEAHHEKRTRHTLNNVIQHLALTTHNDAGKHWRGDHGRPKVADNRRLISTVLKLHQDANGAYIDVHAWKFTPRSFRFIIEQLYRADIVNMNVSHCYGTVAPQCEFCCVLTPRPNAES